jgi:hypothetical protein
LNNKLLWSLSWVSCIVLSAILYSLWLSAMNYTHVKRELSSSSEVNEALDDYAPKVDLLDHTAIHKIPTGIFVQSMEFTDASRVYVTGYVWQHFSEALPSVYDPWKIDCTGKPLPFVFPEAVESTTDTEPQLRYQATTELGHVCGWYFESTLRQKFNYRAYPFDSKTVWLRLWFRKMEKSVVMTPDFDAYDPHSLGNIFGVDEEIVLGSWIPEETYFSYSYSKYTTNFGSQDITLLNENPQLNYNFVIKRKLVDAMVEHLLGIFVVMTLLFATILVVSRHPEKAERHGFNTSSVVGACSALFFVVLISHIQIRSQFGGTDIVYLEIFYYLMYLLLIGTTVNTYLFSEEPNRLTGFLHYRDNIIPKILYWPLILLVSVIATVLML